MSVGVGEREREGTGIGMKNNFVFKIKRYIITHKKATSPFLIALTAVSQQGSAPKSHEVPGL